LPCLGERGVGGGGRQAVGSPPLRVTLLGMVAVAVVGV
jgi:hypothetical protein